MNLLIIDDSKNIREALKKTLSEIPSITKIEEAEDVDDGFNAIINFKPKVVILDLMLKTGTGLELLKRIKNMNNRPRIILYSNFMSDEYIKAAKKLGVDDCFDKSDEILDLLDIIKKYTNNNTSVV